MGFAGGWTGPCRAFADAGYLTVDADYPLGSIPASVGYVARLARRAPKPVYGFGESAGGTIVLDVASEGLLRRVVSDSGVDDLTRWGISAAQWRRMHLVPRNLWTVLHASPAQRRAYSPLYRPLGVAVLLLHGRADTVVPAWQDREMRDAHPRFVTLRTIQGGHVTWDPVGIAQRFFASSG